MNSLYQRIYKYSEKQTLMQAKNREIKILHPFFTANCLFLCHNKHILKDTSTNKKTNSFLTAYVVII